MLVLFLVRVSITGCRFALGAGSHDATWHYVAMEVSSSEHDPDLDTI